MAAEIVDALARISFGMGAFVLALVVLRGPIRRCCGPHMAYGVWIAVPLAGGAMLVDAGWSQNLLRDFARLTAPLAGQIIAVWLSGLAASLALMIFSHIRVLRLARRGKLGPAIAGFLEPRLYLPSDFESRFDVGERAVIRAHERAHLLRRDGVVVYILALGQCLFWFNPLVHLAAIFVRRDQEMACDQDVMAERPEQRGLYARTMLKAQMSHSTSPLVCAWTRHPLEERIAALRQEPSIFAEVLGGLAVGYAGFGLICGFCLSLSAA